MIGGLLLKEARLRAGLSKAELARRSGKAASAIGRWERLEVSPSFETLRELVRAAGFDLSISVVPVDHHDLVLIRRSLAQAPHERLQSLVAAVRAFDDMAAVARG